MTRFSLSLAALFLTCSLCGCGESGPNTYPVTGTVTLDGEPVKEGRIAMRDPEGKVASSGGAITNGEFSFQSQPGAKEVEITARRVVPGKFSSPAPGEKVPLTEQYVPSKYNEESELTKEVAEEENTFEFALTSE